MSPTEPIILRLDKVISADEVYYVNTDVVQIYKDDMLYDLSADIGKLLTDGQPRIIQWLGWNMSTYGKMIYLSGSYKITALESDTDANTG